MDKELGQIAIDFVNNTIHRHKHKKKNYDLDIIVMPRYFFEIWVNGLSVYLNPFINMNVPKEISEMKYMGMKIQYGYENKVIIFNEEYPRSLSDELITVTELSIITK